MAARVPHVVRLDVLEDYRLRLTFDDGLTDDVDLSNLLDAGPVFQPLRDPRFFAQAYIDPQTRTVAWPGGIDLDPEGLREEADKHPIKADPRISRLASQSLLENWAAVGWDVSGSSSRVVDMR